MQGYCDVYKWTILKGTSPEVKCLHLTSSRREMCTLSVSNVIYHKFSHGDTFYTLSGKNVNVMLEFFMNSPLEIFPFSVTVFNDIKILKTVTPPISVLKIRKGNWVNLGRIIHISS